MRSLSKRVTRVCARSVGPVVLLAAVVPASAQTPAQMEYERQQREYWRQQEQQRQEQQRQQQLMQENARRQQGESSRLNAPMPGGGATAGVPGGGAGPHDAAAAQRLTAAREMWMKRPALAADRNPLLGRWQRPPETRGNPNDPFAGVMALAKGGLCEALFGGGGVYEFRADRLMGIDERTRAQELDQVEYRGDAKHVVVLPKQSLKLIEFDFLDANRIQWTGLPNCILVRAGSATPTAARSTAEPTPSNAAPAQPNATAAGSGVLALSVGAVEPGTKIAGRMLWVLKQDPQVALIRGGIQSTPDASVLQNWVRACEGRTPDCQKGMLALKPHSIGTVATDAQGQVRTPPLPAGRYWVFSDTKVAGGKHWMWSQLVDLKGGEASLVLDQRNAMPVN